MIYKIATMCAGILLSITMLGAALSKNTVTRDTGAHQALGAWVSYSCTDPVSGNITIATCFNHRMYTCTITTAAGKQLHVLSPKAEFLKLEAVYNNQLVPAQQDSTNKS